MRQRDPKRRVRAYRRTNALRERGTAIWSAELDGINDAKTYKEERIITSPQSSAIKVLRTKDAEVLNFCANNYLGLSDNKELIEAAKATLDTHGFGLSSVRFICGTQDIHKELEDKISQFHNTDDTILYASCFDANAGIFEVLLGKEDAILTDSLNHASIIDGVRLSKANRFIYKHSDMTDLEEKLKVASEKCRLSLIVTDGVFSMDGEFAKLDEIVRLAQKYDAMILVDDCHATGFVGPSGKGTPEYFGVQDEVHLVNSTLGKALGGATGGYTTGNGPAVELLRQRSRPYLFSNSLAPCLVGAGLKMFDILGTQADLRQQLIANTDRFRMRMKEAGFTLGGENHPIVPVMLGDAGLATQFANEMLALNIYVIGFSYPVVPKGQARIRVQLSAAHTTEQVDFAVDSFIKVGKKLQVIN